MTAPLHKQEKMQTQTIPIPFHGGSVRLAACATTGLIGVASQAARKGRGVVQLWVSQKPKPILKDGGNGIKIENGSFSHARARLLHHVLELVLYKTEHVHSPQANTQKLLAALCSFISQEAEAESLPCTHFQIHRCLLICGSHDYGSQFRCVE
jgi:hypothetical protein